MIVDMGYASTCQDCGVLFEWMPITTAQEFGKVPAHARMMWAGDLPPAEWSGDPLWGGDWWPDTCPKCDANAWFFPVTTGASFFRC